MKGEANAGRRDDERGASAAEYALLITFVAAVIMGAVTVLGLEVLGLYSDSCREVASALDGSSC